MNQAPSCDMHVTPSCRRRAGLPVSTLVSPHPDGGCERSQSGVLMRCPWNQMISTPAKSHKSWWRGRLGTLHSVASHVCYPSAILRIYGAVSISIFYSNLFPYFSCTLACLILCLPTVLLEWLLYPRKQVCILACVHNLVDKGMSLCPAASFSGGFIHPYLWLLSLQLTWPSDPVKTSWPQAGGPLSPCWFELCPHPGLMNPSGLQTLNTKGLFAAGKQYKWKHVGSKNGNKSGRRK